MLVRLQIILTETVVAGIKISIAICSNTSEMSTPPFLGTHALPLNYFISAYQGYNLNSFSNPTFYYALYVQMNAQIKIFTLQHCAFLSQKILGLQITCI